MKHPLVHAVLLQAKFIAVFALNLLHNLVPAFASHQVLPLFGLKVGKGSAIHRGVRFFHLGNFAMGVDSVINSGCYIDNRRGVRIGDNVGIAHDTKIYTLGHAIDDPSFSTQGKPVVIEDFAFVFSNCLIMPGVTIGKGAVVLSGSVVTKDVAPYSVVGGNPAKFIRKRSEDLSYRMRYRYFLAS